MPTLKDFEDLAAKSNSASNQFTLTKEGGLAFKGKGGRLQTYFTSYQKDADVAMLESFHEALREAYGEGAARDGFRRAGLEARLLTGEPLSVREVTAAIRETKAAVIQSENVKYEQQYRLREAEARAWVPTSTASRVEGSGLRLVRQNQGDFRLHCWNAKNNPEDKSQPPAAELDELVASEVTAIKGERQRAVEAGRVVPPMSDRLIYLQAKLNLTERMVEDACRHGNLKEGGPSANIFLGPDMFFSPSDGPRVGSFACEKTSGGAYTEEEMKRITEGLQRISARHPEITLMPGTIVWSKPYSPVPIIDGMPTPADMVYNNAPVFTGGDLVHMTYKMTDGGDADWAAIGVTGPSGKAFTTPSRENHFKARLQIFPEDHTLKARLSPDGNAKVRPILDAMATQARPSSPQREWENRLRRGGAEVRSPYNHMFMVGDKVVALEICRDHTALQAKNEYQRLQGGSDPVSAILLRQPERERGAHLHVLLSASNGINATKTICHPRGFVVQNDVSSGVSYSFRYDSPPTSTSMAVLGERQRAVYNKPDILRTSTATEVPRVGTSSVSVTRVDSVSLAPTMTSGPGTGGGSPSLERLPESGGGTPIVERRPSVRDHMLAGAGITPKPRIGPGLTSTSTRPEGETTPIDKNGTVRSVIGVEPSKPGAPGNTTISVSGL